MVNPLGFHPALVDSPVASIQSPIQPTESLKVAFPIFNTARTHSRHSLVGRESIQAHHLEPRALPCLYSWYLNTARFLWTGTSLESSVESPVKERSIVIVFPSFFQYQSHQRGEGGGRGNQVNHAEPPYLVRLVTSGRSPRIPECTVLDRHPLPTL